jgi:alcohol dehydrogenase (cytochrome c)
MPRRAVACFVAGFVGLVLSTAQVGLRGDGEDWSRPAAREWPLAGGDWHATRYTTLKQIDPASVQRLGGAWLAELPARESQNKVTPIVRAGLMYLVTATSVRAYNAKTGDVAWTQPTNTQSNRGIVLGDGLVFVGQFDASVVALDAKSGKPVWTYREKMDPGQRITGPPTYANGVVVIGVSGGDWFVRCRIVALDAKTGKELWSFYTVPSPGDKGSETWPANNDVWKYGGAAVWTFPAVDVDLGLVYVETGNAVPPWGGELRPGANLYTCSVLALDLKTGTLRWHQQLLHHDVWEADVSTPLVLYDASIGGRARKVLAAMRTDGLLFLMDRETGAFLQRVEERPVKQNAQLKTWPTQPFPVTADRVGPECVPKDTVPEGFLLGCHYDPILPDVPNLTVPYMNMRFSPMSYSPQTGNLYMTGCVYPFWVRRPDEPWLGFGPVVGHIPGQKSYGILAALDGRTGKTVWQKRLPYPSCGGSGTLATATGLLFTGDPGGNFQAYDVKSGGLVWQFQTGSLGPWSPALGPGTGPAISYEIDGEQYLAFTIDRAIWAFRIGGPIDARPAPEPLPAVEPFRGAVRETDKITLAAMVTDTNPATGRRYEWKSEHAVSPVRAQAALGTAVTWVNNGSLTHTIVAQDRSWTTGPIRPGASASVTFNKTGTFAYICADHPWSISQLIVEP